MQNIGVRKMHRHHVISDSGDFVCDVAGVADVARPKKRKKFAILRGPQLATPRYRLGIAGVAMPPSAASTARPATSATPPPNLGVATAHAEKLAQEQAMSHPATSDFVSGRVYDDAPAEWEQRAAKIITMRCPAAVSAERWRRLQLDSCCFVRDGWAAKAADLGWATLDLWGCHPQRPLQRVDLAGALWLLGGGDITAISDSVIAIRTSTGPLLAFYRRQHRPAVPVVPAWELAQ